MEWNCLSLSIYVFKMYSYRIFNIIRIHKIFSYSYLRTCECPGKVREPLADEFLGRERVADAKRTRLACDSAVERFENIVEGPSLACKAILSVG